MAVLQQEVNLAQQTECWAHDLLAENPLLLDKISRSMKLSSQQITDGLTETLRFLWLCSKSKQVLTPSHNIDLLWHELILFTRSYAKFCEQHFGKFIHHQPSNQPANELQQYLLTLKLYQEHFAQSEPFWWPHPNQSTHCGACED